MKEYRDGHFARNIRFVATSQRGQLQNSIRARLLNDTFTTMILQRRSMVFVLEPNIEHIVFHLFFIAGVAP